MGGKCSGRAIAGREVRGGNGVVPAAAAEAAAVLDRQASCQAEAFQHFDRRIRWQKSIYQLDNKSQ